MEIKYRTNNYCLLSWRGIADGTTPLTPDFDINFIKNKIITIKSIQSFFYNNDGDESGVGAILFHWVEQTNNLDYRISNEVGGNVRIPDYYKELGDFGGFNTKRMIELTINNSLLDCFSTAQMPNHFKLDNILIQFPSAVQSIKLVVNACRYINYNPVVNSQLPNIIFFMEVYKQDPFKDNLIDTKL